MRLSLDKFRNSPVLQLSALVLGGLLVYMVGFLAPANLLELYARPRLDRFLLFDAGVPGYVRLVLAYIAAWALYLLGYRISGKARGRGAWLVVLGGMLVFSTAFLFLAPFDAADIYDNIMHGRILGVYGANPFIRVIADYPQDAFHDYAAWKRAISAYGPLWEILAGVTARLAGNGVIANVLAFKTLAGLFHFASVGAVALILRREAPERALGGVLLLAWNPVVLYETWGNGHNDLAMAFWFLAAAWLVSRRRYTYAVLALVMGGLFKYLPILMVPAVAWIGWRDMDTMRARLEFLGMSALLSFVMIAAAYAPFWNGVDSFSIGRRMGMFTVSIPAVVYRLLAPGLGKEASGQLVSLAALGILAAFVLYRSLRVKAPASAGEFARVTFTILVFYLLVTCLWFQQWYSLWLVCLAPLLAAPGRRLALVFSFWVVSKQLAFGPLIVPTMYFHPETAVRLEPWLTVSILGVPWIYALWVLITGRIRSGKHAAS
jgi:hypothetical protein